MIDFDAWERDVAEGKSPRHSTPVLARRLGAMVNQAGRDAPPAKFGDRLRSRLFGTPASWAFVRHTAPRLGRGDVVYCLDQVVGVPMAAALRRSVERPKLAIHVNNLDRPRGRLAAKLFRIADTVDLFFTNCTTQLEFLQDRLKVDADRTFLLLEHVDNRFFVPGPPTPGKLRPLVASVGLEQRDYRTLASATHDLDVDVKVGAWSRYAGLMARSFPDPLPANMTRRSYKFPELVQLYRDADIVATPLFPCKQAAGVTTLMEGLACSRPLLVTRSPGLSDSLSPPDGLSIVEPSNPAALRAAIIRLLDHPEEAQAQARQGYESVVLRYDFDRYIETVARRLEAL